MLRRLPALALIACCALLAPRPTAAELLWSLEFDSAALGAAMRYSIYLPPGYHDPRRADRRYPVVYLLHGVGDDERAWPALGRVETTMNALIAAGDLPPFIVVMPDARKSWYVDSGTVGGPGDYATAVRDDLREHAETRWRATDDRDGRFIAGLSMGGFGALRLAFERPELYRGVGAMSSALWNRVEPGWQPADPARMIRIFDGSFGAPFDPVRFIAQHPRRHVERIRNPVEPLGIYLQAGDDDGFGTQFATIELFRELRELGIPAELRIDDGDHQWPVWRRALGPMILWFAGLMKPAGE